MSFFGKASKMKKKKKDAIASDDGLESFGLFCSSMLDNADRTKTARSTKLRPSQGKAPKIQNMISRLTAKDNARNRKVDQSAAIPRRVTPLPKQSSASASSEKRPILQSRKRASGTATKAAGNKKQAKGSSQAGISSFFTLASNMKKEGSTEVQVQPQNCINAKVDSSTELSDAGKSTLEPTILAYDLPVIPQTSHDSAANAETNASFSLSRSSSMKSTPEEISSITEKEADSKQCLKQKKEEKRRKENKRVFGRRIASSHLLAQLERRCTHNTRCDHNMDAGYHGMRGNVLRKWSRIHNIHLEVGMNDAEITCMEFDSDGVLLAIADNSGYIRIFDFDEVNAADIATRRKHQKEGTSQRSRPISPFIMFRTGTDRISSLTWNPFNENIVAVTFFNKREVRIFDVSTSSNTGPFYSSLIDNNSRSTSSSSLKFVSVNRVLVGGNDGTLSLWKYTPPSRGSNSTQNRAIWFFNPWGTSVSGGITEIVHLSSSPSKEKNGLLLVATSIGCFSLIDMNCCSRKSFSSCMTPKILSIWNISQLSALKKHVLPSSKWMGAKKIFVWSDKPTFRDGKLGMDKTVEVAVVTSGGWVIALKFDVTKSKVAAMTARVVHRSPTVIQCDSSQTSLYDGPDAPASVPDFASVHGIFDKTTSLIVVTKTKPMYQVLPDYDKRVLGQSIGNGGLIRSNMKADGPDGLAVIHRHVGAQFDIPIDGKLKQLVIHPDNEWILATTISSAGQRHLQLMNLRSEDRTPS